MLIQEAIKASKDGRVRLPEWCVESWVKYTGEEFVAPKNNHVFLAYKSLMADKWEPYIEPSVTPEPAPTTAPSPDLKALKKARNAARDKFIEYVSNAAAAGVYIPHETRDYVGAEAEYQAAKKAVKEAK